MTTYYHLVTPSESPVIDISAPDIIPYALRLILNWLAFLLAVSHFSLSLLY
jgi:hypothetical protein